MPVHTSFLQKIPMQAATTAAEAYVQQNPEGSFSDFYTRHHLDEARSYHEFSPLCSDDPLLSTGEPEVSEIAALNLLLDAAVDDVAEVYAVGQKFLLAEVVQSESEIITIMQRSKRFGRMSAAIPSRQIRTGLAKAPRSGRPICEAAPNSGDMQEVVFTREFYQDWIAPFRHKRSGCPMLAKIAINPVTSTKVLLYDLYWEATVVQASRALAQEAGRTAISPATEMV